MLEKFSKEYSEVWKFFFQQKLREICIFLLVASIAFLVPFALGNISVFIGLMSKKSLTGVILFDRWLTGLFPTMILGLIGYILYQWFKSNWDRAMKRAGKGDVWYG